MKKTDKLLETNITLCLEQEVIDILNKFVASVALIEEHLASQGASSKRLMELLDKKPVKKQSKKKKGTNG